MHHVRPRGRTQEKKAENIWRNNDWKLPKFKEKHEINIHEIQQMPSEMNS